MDRNVKPLESLQEAFRGSIDPEVVDLIFTECNYVADDALEKLLSISVSDSSSDNLCNDSEKQSTKHYDAASIEDNSYSPTDRNTSRRDKKAPKLSPPFQDDKSNSLPPKGHLGHAVVDTDNSVAITQREIPDSSEQLSTSTKEAVEPKKPYSFPHKHNGNHSTLVSHSGQDGIEVTDQPQSSSELPPWPDYHHGYPVPRMQSFPRQPYNAYQGIPARPVPISFQGQRFSGDARYSHYMPQHRPQQNMGTYYFQGGVHQAPGFRYPSGGLHPGENSTFIKRKEFQPQYGTRKPRESYPAEQKHAFSKSQTRSEETILPSDKLLVVLRGLPGSGKTTLAQKLKGNGVILSTDDFFMTNGMYQYEQYDLSMAHEWNQKRAKDCMQRGVSPIIIDNTNTQAWEMRPYISMGKRFGYKVIIKEPDTPWKWNTKELFKRNQHNVTMFSLQNMKDRYQKDLTVESILAPSWKKHENVNPKIEMCSNRDEKPAQNSDYIKPMSVAPKERSRNKQTSKDEFSQELSLASENDKDVSNSGISRQSENKRKKQVKSPVSSPHKPFTSISQLSKQSPKQSKKKSEDIRQEVKHLRSHGSRSPIQDVDFSLPGLAEDVQSLEISDSFIKNGHFNTESILPKPQRTTKRRERQTKPLEKMQNTELDSKEAKFDLCKNEPESTLVISDSETSSEEEEFDDEKRQKLITGLAIIGEDTPCYKTSTEASSEMTEETTPLSDNDEDLLRDALMEQDIISIGKEVDYDDAGESTGEISHRDMENSEFLLPRSPLTDESKREEFGLRSFAATDIKNDEETSVNAKDSDEPFKTTKIVPGFYSAEEIEIENENAVENFKNDLSESDLSGFQFLNTCFPDIDIQILVDVLDKNQGDVTKAVESILHHEDKSAEVKKQKMPNIDSSEKTSLLKSSFERESAQSAPDDALKLPPEGGQFQESQTSLKSLASHVGSEHGHFQMTLEPAVAIHLLELFGPIGGISMEGDFSSNDLIVEVESDFAKLLYKQWRKTIQNNFKEKSFHTENPSREPTTEAKKDSTRYKRLQEMHGKQSNPFLAQHKATDLRQIMDEQMAVEQSRQEQVQSDESMAVVLKRQKLYAMFPGVDPSALDELFEVNRYELQPTVSMVETSCNLQAKQQSEFQERQENATSNSKSYDDVDVIKEPMGTEFQTLHDPDYEDFRAEANTHYQLRDECFRKAAFAFSKKQGQLAQFYASQGHMHTEKIRQANKRAAARILEHKNSSGDETSLDLHGLHVDEALAALEERLLFAESVKNYGPKHLSVITGKGLHSKQGKAKIKPAVLEYLQRNNYRFEEMQPGLVRVAVSR